MKSVEKLKQFCEKNFPQEKIEQGIYKVYAHINTINDKIYVGITKQKLEYRWREGKGYHNGTRIREAIDKYGWENFDHILLFENISTENALNIEEILIKEFNLQDIENGYNMAPGGDIPSMQGRHHTEEAKKKMTQALLDRYKKNPDCHPWKGRKHTEEAKKKMMQNSQCRQEVRCVETGIIYPSIREATRQMGLKSKNSIILALENPEKTAKGYHWERTQKGDKNERY